jgi:hypothetical protein
MIVAIKTRSTGILMGGVYSIDMQGVNFFKLIQEGDFYMKKEKRFLYCFLDI